MNRKVTFVRFHQGLHLPSVGNVGDSLPGNSKTYSKLDMWAYSAGLQIDIAYAGRSTCILVPWANVIVAELGPEQPKEPAVTAAA